MLRTRTFLARTYFAFRYIAMWPKEDRLFQQLLVEQLPETPWHLHCSLRVFFTAYEFRNQENINYEHFLRRPVIINTVQQYYIAVRAYIRVLWNCIAPTLRPTALLCRLTTALGFFLLPARTRWKCLDSTSPNWTLSLHPDHSALEFGLDCCTHAQFVNTPFLQSRVKVNVEAAALILWTKADSLFAGKKKGKIS